MNKDGKMKHLVLSGVLLLALAHRAESEPVGATIEVNYHLWNVLQWTHDGTNYILRSVYTDLEGQFVKPDEPLSYAYHGANGHDLVNMEPPRNVSSVTLGGRTFGVRNERTSVPEPATSALFLAGGVALFLLRKVL